MKTNDTYELGDYNITTCPDKTAISPEFIKYFEAIDRLQEYVATASPESPDIILATELHLAKIDRLHEEVAKAWKPIQIEVEKSYQRDLQLRKE